MNLDKRKLFRGRFDPDSARCSVAHLVGFTSLTVLEIPVLRGRYGLFSALNDLGLMLLDLGLGLFLCSE